jgi:hypothetical protein
MSTARATSFRLRLAFQTIFIAGFVVAGFGAGAWWFAMEQQARNHDLRIAQEARRLWTQLTPRHREPDFVLAAQKTFGPNEDGVALSVMWHTEDHTFATISGPVPSEANRSIFLDHLPQGPAVVTRPADSEGSLRQARALSADVASGGRFSSPSKTRRKPRANGVMERSATRTTPFSSASPALRCKPGHAAPPCGSRGVV